jgi:hemolysin D
LLDNQIQAHEQLVQMGHFPRLRLYELEEERIERLRNLDVQTAAAAKAQAAMSGIDAQLRQLRSELARTTVKDLAEAQDNSDLRTSEISKTDMRNRLMRLTSPVDGTVQQLAVHTLGGVVEPARTLLVIVPKGSQLTIEAKIPNKDAGFVRVGQAVRVKVDAFPFTDYGTVDGILESISSDAVEDEKLGLVYDARIRLQSNATRGRSKGIALAPGMTVAAEIKTARRRVIQYLLSPIAARLDEAGRER